MNEIFHGLYSENHHTLESGFFPVIQYSKRIQYECKAANDGELLTQVSCAASFQYHHAHHGNKIAHGIETCYQLCPVGHAVDRGEQSAHKYENHHEKEHDEHGLLLRFAKSGNKQPQSQHGQQVNGNKAEEHQQVACGHNAIEYPRYQQADDEHHVTEHPEGDQLSQYEMKFFNGRYIYLLDGAHFLFLYNVQR